MQRFASKQCNAQLAQRHSVAPVSASASRVEPQPTKSGEWRTPTNRERGRERGRQRQRKQREGEGEGEGEGRHTLRSRYTTAESCINSRGNARAEGAVTQNAHHAADTNTNTHENDNGQ